MPKGYYNRFRIPKAARKIARSIAFELAFGRPPRKGEWVKRRLKEYAKEKRDFEKSRR